MAWLTWRSWPTVTATYRGSCDPGGQPLDLVLHSFVSGRIMGLRGFGEAHDGVSG